MNNWNKSFDYVSWTPTQKACVKIYSLAVFADEHERDRVYRDGFFACKWWCIWRWTWFRWHKLRHSLSELVLCYLASNDFFIGGNDEHECPAPDWLIAGQWLSDVVPVVDVARGVWFWVCLRTDNDFFWREISLRNSPNFFSMSFLRWNHVKLGIWLQQISCYQRLPWLRYPVSLVQCRFSFANLQYFWLNARTNFSSLPDKKDPLLSQSNSKRTFLSEERWIWDEWSNENERNGC